MNVVLYARTIPEIGHILYDDCCFGGTGSLPSFPNKLLNAGLNMIQECNAIVHILEPHNQVTNDSTDQELVDCAADAVVFPVVEPFEKQMIRTYEIAKEAGIKPICVTPSPAYGQFLIKKYPGLEYKPVSFPINDSIHEEMLMSPYGFSFHRYVPNYQIGIGCINSCSFCIWSGVKSQMKEVPVAIQDLKLMERYTTPLLTPYLLCSSLIQNSAWFNWFAREKLYQLPDMKYITDINPIDITHDKVGLLKMSGCERIIVGIESANNIVRREINKPGTIEQVQEKLDLLKSESIKIQSSFLYGLTPNEDGLIDACFAKANPNIEFNTGIVKCYKGTPIEIYSDYALNFNGNKIMTTAHLDEAIKNMEILKKEIPSIEIEQITRW